MKIVNKTQAELGISSQDTLLLLMQIASDKIDTIVPTSSSLNVDDIDGFGLAILRKSVKMLDTLVFVCVRLQDYVVANAIVRMLADSLAVYRLIYASEDEDERIYRHYLYVKDGLSSRVDTMEHDLVYNGTISYEAFQALNDRYTDTRQSDKSVINHCDEILANHKYATLYQEFHRRTCTEKSPNWKYKTLGSDKNAKDNQYRWKELYELLDASTDVISCLSSHLSQYIHGLCVSNILDDNDIEEFEPLLSFGMVFIGIINQELDKLKKL